MDAVVYVVVVMVVGIVVRVVVGMLAGKVGKFCLLDKYTIGVGNVICIFSGLVDRTLRPLNPTGGAPLMRCLLA